MNWAKMAKHEFFLTLNNIENLVTVKTSWISSALGQGSILEANWSAKRKRTPYDWSWIVPIQMTMVDEFKCQT